jgi:two-component system KDP operon response regulator KdpE
VSTILLVEDNRAYAETLKSNLEREGYEVTVAATGLAGLEAAKKDPPDLMILDLMLPAMNGFTVLQRLRDEGHETPVLIMTALGTEEEKLRGFGLGADDYVVKPCGLLEILARVRALLKRASTGPGEPRSEIRVEDLTIDFGARLVRRGQTEITLRPKEFDLLRYLVSERGKPVPHRELLQAVWGPDYGDQTDYLRVFITHLRKKIEPNPSKPKYILTDPWLGYRFSD